MPDKFPEAFGRFAKDVRVDKIRDFNQGKLVFSEWGGGKMD